MKQGRQILCLVRELIPWMLVTNGSHLDRTYLVPCDPVFVIITPKAKSNRIATPINVHLANIQSLMLLICLGSEVSDPVPAKAVR